MPSAWFDACELGLGWLKGHLPVCVAVKPRSTEHCAHGHCSCWTIFFYSYDDCTFLHVIWHIFLWKCSYTITLACEGGYSAPPMVALGWGALFVGTCYIGSHRWCVCRAMQEDDTLKRSDADPLSDGALKCMFYTNLKSPNNSDRVTFSIANSACRPRLSLNRRIHERTIETFICKKWPILFLQTQAAAKRPLCGFLVPKTPHSILLLTHSRDQ